MRIYGWIRLVLNIESLTLWAFLCLCEQFVDIRWPDKSLVAGLEIASIINCGKVRGGFCVYGIVFLVRVVLGLIA